MKKFNKSVLKVAITSALLSSINFSVNAAEENASSEEVERIEVTGSRIQRTDMESALPVTTLTSADISATGLTDLSAVIAQMPYNTQGSFVSAGGSSAQNHSSSGMRGLGSERTLTLINGRRIAPSATFGGTSTNLNFVPIEAVERIDILRDGASAIYGSDAIGGVINIILKKDFEGLLVKGSFANPTRGQRDEAGVSLTFGSQGERARSTVVMEHKQWEGLAGGGSGRPQLEADWETGYNRSSLYSPYGTYRPVDAEGNAIGDRVPGPNCPADKVVVNSPTDSRCGFNYLDGKDFLPDRKKDSIFGHLGYDITDNLVWDSQVMVLFDSSETASTSINTGFGTANFYMEADNPNNPTFGTANPQRIQYWSRMNGAADRETTFDSNVLDFSTSLTYNTDMGSLKVDLQHSTQKVNIKTEHYVFEDRFREAVADGRWNPFVLGGNASAEDMALFQHTFTREAETVSKAALISWASDTNLELGGGTLAYSIGAEYRDDTYVDQMDRQTANGEVLGAFGGDSAGERSYKAAFAEVDLPVLESLTLKVATRYDQYSVPDKGKLSSAINARYQALDSLVLRASYGQGFRAPSLDDLLGDEALSFNRVIDTTSCQALPPADREGADVCEPQQIERRSAGNEGLNPEESDQYSLGLVWDIVDGTSMTVDYYNIEINEQVQFLSAQSVVDLEAAGLLSNFDPNRINITRDADGTLTNVNTSSINMAGITTSGIDLSVKSRFDLGDYGELRYSFEGSYTLEYETQDTPTSPRFDEVGYQDTPEYRFNTGFGYSIGDFDANLTYRYTAAFKGQTPEDELANIPRQDFSSWNTIDLSASYTTDQYGKLTVGARNLTDNIADLNDELRDGFNDAFHDIIGRVVYANYSIAF